MPSPTRHSTLAGDAVLAAAVGGCGFAVWLAFERLAFATAGPALEARLEIARTVTLVAVVALAVAWRHRRDVGAPEAETEVERQARKTRLLCERIVENVQDAVVLWHAEGGILFASASAERLFGRDTVELRGLHVEQLLSPRAEDPENGGRWAPPDESAALPHGRMVPVWGRDADGDLFPAELLTSDVLTDTPPLVIGIVRDVRDRELAAEAQRRSESLRLLIDGLPDAVFVHRARRLVYANRTFLDRLGCTRPEEVLGSRLESLLHPTGVKSVLRRLDQLHSTGKPLPPAEELFRHRDGSAVPLEVAKVPVDFDGEPSVVAIGRDVAERRRAEERFRIAVESAPSGMIMVDPHGRVLMVNGQILDLFGYEETELLGSSVDVLVPERIRDQHPALRDRFQESPSPRAMGSGRDLHGVRKDGTEIPVEIGLNPIETEEGVMVLASVVDIRERKRTEGVLAAADRMSAVGTLAAGVAHGINNPLAFVKGNLIFGREQIEQVLPDLSDAGVREDLGEVALALHEAEEGSDRIRDIVGDLLTFSRRDAGVDEARADVHAVLESVLQIARNEIRHRARVERRYGQVPHVAGAPSHLAHAFANLVINAAQAIPEGQAEQNCITLETHEDTEGRIVVEIADTGPGIPGSVRPHIFEPFFTTKPVGTGTGLGLAVTHGIVTRVGGSIDVEREPERGTRFRVVLPPAPPREEQAGPVRQIGDESTARLRVLVVDDEPSTLRMMARLLRDVCEHVETAMSGRDALARIDAGARYDAVICDLLMPEVTGMQLYEALRERAPDQARRIVFSTGGAFTPSARAFLERVPNPLLDKPVDRGVLLGILQGLGRSPSVAHEEPDSVEEDP